MKFKFIVIKTLNYDEISFPIRLEYFLKANVISVIGYHAITDFEKSAKEVKYYELIKKIYIRELKTKVQIKYGNPTQISYKC